MIRYVVNQEKRTVVAILQSEGGLCEDAYTFFDKHFGVDCASFFIPINNDDEFYIENKYVGIAKCHPDDEWDETIGKRIAKKRCLSQYYNDRDAAVLRMLDQSQKAIYRVLDKVSASISKVQE